MTEMLTRNRARRVCATVEIAYNPGWIFGPA